MRVGATLADALHVYRLLWARSVLVAAIVYALIALIQIVQHVAAGGLAALLGLVAAIVTLAGPALVQGALIGIVRNVHEGRVPASIQQLLADARARLARLVGAALLYALGVFAGLLLLVVPGLIVAARWSLMPAVVMLEEKSVGEARRRSGDLVEGHTGAVLGCLLISGVVVVAPSVVLIFAKTGFGTSTFIDFVWSALTAPFVAHLLTVIYYRRADAGEPVIHPNVLAWRNVWEGR